MPTIDSTDTALKQSADVPQLPKPIRCLEATPCDSWLDGQGCQHAMSEAEIKTWLEMLRGHRIAVESGKSPTPRKSKASTPESNEPKEHVWKEA